MKKRALISVTDKTGVVSLARRLVELGFEIVSTGGTAKAITEAGIPCTLVEKVTGFPEMLDGRVKTLHPNIFAGIIADQQDHRHMEKIAEYSIETFGIVVVNLYNFEDSPSIANIDVGGPSMIRAAAKNYESVAVVVDPRDYKKVTQEIDSTGSLSESTRFWLACKAFDATAHYDVMIAKAFDYHLCNGSRPKSGDKH